MLYVYIDCVLPTVIFPPRSFRGFSLFHLYTILFPSHFWGEFYSTGKWDVSTPPTQMASKRTINWWTFPSSLGDIFPLSQYSSKTIFIIYTFIYIVDDTEVTNLLLVLWFCYIEFYCIVYWSFPFLLHIQFTGDESPNGIS